MLRARKLIEVVTADHGVPQVDYGTPFKRGAMSTGFRYDPSGQPTPFQRHRLIPGTDRYLTQFFAYKRDAAPVDVLKALKRNWELPVVQQLVRRAAVYLARAIRQHAAPDAVLPAPSSSGLSTQLARELAARLGGIPVLKPPRKVNRMAKIGVPERMKFAKQNFEVPDQPYMNGVILVVDDFTTSGATLVGLAANLLDHPDVTDVVAAALAIH
jgi:predicted amidophosphoribosyltransferase